MVSARDMGLEAAERVAAGVAGAASDEDERDADARRGAFGVAGIGAALHVEAGGPEQQSADPGETFLRNQEHGGAAAYGADTGARAQVDHPEPAQILGGLRLPEVA